MNVASADIKVPIKNFKLEDIVENRETFNEVIKNNFKRTCKF